MTTSTTNVSTPPARLATAVVRLLDASERASIRGNTKWARLYASKASQATAALHSLAIDALETTIPRPVRRLRNSERIS